MTLRTILLGLAALAAAGCGKGPGSTGTSRPPVPVETQKVARRDLVRTYTEMATLAATETVEISAEVSGRLVELPYDEGDSVEGGAVVARLDATVPSAQVEQAKAQLARARARSAQTLALEAKTRSQELQSQARVREAEAGLAQSRARAVQGKAEVARAQATVHVEEASVSAARTVLAREERVSSQGATSGEKLQSAKDALAIAEAKLEAARAGLDAAGAAADVADAEVGVAEADLEAVGAALGGIAAELAAAAAEIAATAAEEEAAAAALAVAEATLAKYAVKAPAPGVVVWRGKEPGEMVTPATFSSTGFLRIEPLDPLRAETNLPEGLAGMVRQGGDVPVEVDGRTATGRVFRIARTVDRETRTVKVEVDVPNPDGRIRSGAFGRVTFALDERKGALAIPAVAVRREVGGAAFVLVAREKDGADVACRCDVELGLEAGGWVEVVSGVGEGEEIVTLGAGSLGDGARIAPRSAAGALERGSATPDKNGSTP
ncbi:MAG: efflux RND transporter periplasmic adaptor subunit [Planctomycetes bacterium]|nr:efflux RND transporter periplasmic adaptor subunit [Planctomycetota bacterium]